MPTYKVLKSYYDTQLAKQLNPGEEVELTQERAEFIISHLERFCGGFLEEVKTEKKVRSKKKSEDLEE